MVVSGEAHPFPVSAGSPSIGQAAYSEKALIRRVQPFRSLECLCPLNPDRHPATRERDLERSGGQSQIVAVPAERAVCRPVPFAAAATLGYHVGPGSARLGAA